MVIRAHSFGYTRTPFRLAAHRSKISQNQHVDAWFWLIHTEYINLIIFQFIEQIKRFQTSSKSRDSNENWILYFMLKLKGFDDSKFWNY